MIYSLYLKFLNDKIAWFEAARWLNKEEEAAYKAYKECRDTFTYNPAKEAKEKEKNGDHADDTQGPSAPTDEHDAGQPVGNDPA